MKAAFLVASRVATLLGCLLGALVAPAQTPTPGGAPNFVRTWTARRAGVGPRAATAANGAVNPASAGPFTNPSGALSWDPACLERTRYIDGFGRVVEEVAARSTVWSGDWRQPHLYDAFGRETKQLLPFAADFSGNYHPRPQDSTDQQQFYAASWDCVADDNTPWARTEYESAGPASRPIRTTGGAGQAWQFGGGHYEEFWYGTNANETIRRLTWEDVEDALAGRPLTNYPSNPASALPLAVRKHYDADNRLAVEYTDGDGHLVLKKAQISAGQWAATAYVYDAFGRRRLILQPEGNAALDAGEALTENLLRRWAFRYDYDDHGRLAHTYVPGGTDVWYVYGHNNQVALTGQIPAGTPEGAPAGQLQWLCTKYDELDHPILTAIWDPTRPVIQPGYSTYHPAPLTTDPAEARKVLQLIVDGSFRWIPVDSTVTPLTCGNAYWSTGQWPSTVASESWDTNKRDYTLTNSFPYHGITTANTLTRTYYDTYDVKARPAGHVFAPVDIAGSAIDPADPHQPGFRVSKADTSARVNDLVTIQQERVLGDTTFWLTTTTWYDHRGRPLQTYTDLPNPTGTGLAGWERTTWQRDFTGAVTQQLTEHQYQADPGTPDHRHTLYTRLQYDSAGRLTRTDLKLDNFPLVRHSQLSYNQLGQVVDKRLHSMDRGKSWLQSVDFRYNIRGWLTHINDRSLGHSPQQTPGNDPNFDGPTAHDPALDGGDLFGLELKYNTGLVLSPGISSSLPHPQAQFGGNIGEQLWTTATPRHPGGGRGPLTRGYQYRYDGLSRLTGADFRTWLPSVPGNYTAPWTWNLRGGDYSTSHITYDRNGNLLTLRRRGDGAGGAFAPEPLDELTFSYAAPGGPRSNRLLAVSDAVQNSVPTHDFEGQGADEWYAYDARGNLLTDPRKGLTQIAYTHLNLPHHLEWDDGRALSFAYAATGRRLSKTVSDPASGGGAAQVSARVGAGFAYETGELVSVDIPEGRLLYDPAADEPRRWQWEYHCKDHLGNLRLAVRVAMYPDDAVVSSFEPGHLRGGGSAEPCRGVDAVRVRRPQRARTGEHLVVLGQPAGGGTAHRVVGPVLRRSVSAGDSVYAQVWGSYDAPLRPGLPAVPLLPSLAQEPETVAGAGKSPGRFLPRLRVQLAGLLTHRDPNAPPVPAAYLLVSLFSADSVLLARQPAYLQDSIAPGQWQELTAQLKATAPGYVEVKLVDESVTVAYFDDLALRLVKERGIQENHYDPWGLNLVGIETEALDRPEMRQYNGKEKVSDFGLEWNFHDQRTYDKQAPHWWQIDPSADVAGQESMSPYEFGADNPVRYSDPKGDCPICPFIIAAALIAAAQPALAPTRNAEANRQAYAQGQAQYGVSVAGALMPVVAEGKATQILYQNATAKVTQVVANEVAGEIKGQLGQPKLLPQTSGPVGHILPSEVIGKTPAQIDARAREIGLVAKGADPINGKGAYIDPATGKQRILVHSDATPPHGHVNNSAGQRLDRNSNVVPNKSAGAHLDIDTR